MLLFGGEDSSPLRLYANAIMGTSVLAGAIIQDMLTLVRRGVQTRQVVNLNNLISAFMETPKFDKIAAFYPDVRIETRMDTTLLNSMVSSHHITNQS